MGVCAFGGVRKFGTLSPAEGRIIVIRRIACQSVTSQRLKRGGVPQASGKILAEHEAASRIERPLSQFGRRGRGRQWPVGANAVQLSVIPAPAGIQYFEIPGFPPARERLIRRVFRLTERSCRVGAVVCPVLKAYRLLTRLAGNLAVKQLPTPGVLLISSCAWWRFSECLTMARPRPVPPASRERPRSTR